MKKLILAVTFLSLLNLSLASCTKNNVNPAILPNGTKCTIRPGVFSSGSYQPSQPVIIDDVYKQSDGSTPYYDVTDTKGVVWQIPGSDLQAMK